MGIDLDDKSEWQKHLLAIGKRLPAFYKNQSSDLLGSASTTINHGVVPKKKAIIIASNCSRTES